MGNFDSQSVVVQEKFSSGPHGIALIFTTFQILDRLELTSEYVHDNLAPC